MRAAVDVERAKLVASLVHRSFQGGDGLLSEKGDLVENQLPPGVQPLSKEHARFLFLVIPNDHGVRSRRLYERAKTLFSTHPDYFDPYRVVAEFEDDNDPRLAREITTTLGARYPRAAGRSWYLNSRTLAEKFDGDPRLLLASSDDARDLLHTICSFHGYGQKVGGMFLRAAVGLRWADVRGLEEVLLPVDIHDCRISLWTGVLRFDESLPMDKRLAALYPGHVKSVQHALLTACNALGIDWLDVDRGLWLIGSMGCAKGQCHACPLVRECSNARLD
jgi:hypothetical protein